MKNSNEGVELSPVTEDARKVTSSEDVLESVTSKGLMGVGALMALYGVKELSQGDSSRGFSIIAGGLTMALIGFVADRNRGN